MPTSFDPTSTDEPKLTREAFYSLEQKLQDLKLRVMRRAAQFAKDRGVAQATIDDVHRALRWVVKEGLLGPLPMGAPIRAFPQDSYMYLEKRLHFLRMLAIRWATREGNDDVTPEDIEMAWEKVCEKPSVLLPVLAAEEPLVG